MRRLLLTALVLMLFLVGCGKKPTTGNSFTVRVICQAEDIQKIVLHIGAEGEGGYFWGSELYRDKNVENSSEYWVKFPREIISNRTLQAFKLEFFADIGGQSLLPIGTDTIASSDKIWNNSVFSYEVIGQSGDTYRVEPSN